VKSIAGLMLLLTIGCVAAPETAPAPLDFAHFRVEETPSAVSLAAVSPGAAATAHLPAAAPSFSGLSAAAPTSGWLGSSEASPQDAGHWGRVEAPRSQPPAAASPAVPSVSLGDEPSFDLGTGQNKHPQAPLSPGVASHIRPPDAPPADGDAFADAGPNPDVGAHWSGALIYCQPGCGPCATLERDLTKAGWRVGTKGSPHFKVVSLETLAEFQARNVPSTPCIAYFVDGQEVPPRIVGYNGTQAMLVQICARHPKAKKLGWLGSSGANPQLSRLWGRTEAIPSQPPTFGSPLYYESTDCGAPMLTADCGVPTVSYSQPVVTSDFGELSRAVTYSDPIYSAPPRYYAAAPPYQTTFQAGPANYSAGLSLFGFPLIGGSAGARF
jgi:hypothetical protein